jgi:hypothetical protein
LPKTHTLSLSHSQVSDDDLIHLKGLTNLVVLDLPSMAPTLLHPSVLRSVDPLVHVA